MSARLVVLGSCGAWPEPGRACAGFVLEIGGVRLALDLGYGTLPRLLGHLNSLVADGLDAVVITHRHADHALDLHGLFRARWFGTREAPPIPLYAPRDVLDQVIALEDADAAAVERVFAWHPLPASPYELDPYQLDPYQLDPQQSGPVTISSWPLPHYVPNAGVRIASPEVVVAYTGDTGPDEALPDLGRNCDLFIVEATDRHQQDNVPPTGSGVELNLTSGQAGRIAADAGARRLLLTHFWPGNDREAGRAAAAEHFAGEILLADEGLDIHVR